MALKKEIQKKINLKARLYAIFASIIIPVVSGIIVVPIAFLIVGEGAMTLSNIIDSTITGSPIALVLSSLMILSFMFLIYRVINYVMQNTDKRLHNEDNYENCNRKNKYLCNVIIFCDSCDGTGTCEDICGEFSACMTCNGRGKVSG